jgi:hypothetical protein
LRQAPPKSHKGYIAHVITGHAFTMLVVSSSPPHIQKTNAAIILTLRNFDGPHTLGSHRSVLQHISANTHANMKIVFVNIHNMLTASCVFLILMRF